MALKRFLIHALFAASALLIGTIVALLQAESPAWPAVGGIFAR